MDIEEFKCGYRFTDEKYSVFSRNELSNIEIILSEKVKKNWCEICDNDVIEKSSFINKIVSKEMPVLISDCGWGDSEKEKITEDILNKFFDINSADVITVFYDCETAINVLGSLFCTRWTDFCYPSDVLLIKKDKKVLLYYEDIIYILNR